MSDTDADSTTERDTSCNARIQSHQAGRERQFTLWFGDLDGMDDEDVIELAVTDCEQFDLTDHERSVLEAYVSFEASVNLLEAHGKLPEDVPMLDENDEDSTVGDQHVLLAARAREVIQEARDEGNVGDAVLAVSTSIRMRVELSTGGPADYLTCELDPEDRTVSDVVYHFADWFDHAARPVHDGPLVNLCNYFAEGYDPSQ